MRHLAGIAAVSCKQFPIPRDIEMDRPLIPLQVIPRALPGSNVVSGYPESFTARRLQVIPYRRSISAPKLMARNFHLHRAVMDFCELSSIRANSPDTVYFVPG